MTHVHIINALEVTILYVILLKMKDSCGAAAEPLTENGEDGWFGRFGETPPLPSLEGMLQRRGLSDLYSHPFTVWFIQELDQNFRLIFDFWHGHA